MTLQKSPGRQLSDQLSNKDQNLDSAQRAAREMVGLISRIAAETVYSDIALMIQKSKRTELDGYIFCLSRVVQHKFAWECIVKAFADQNETVPAKYFSYFNKEKGEDSPAKRMIVQ